MAAFDRQSPTPGDQPWDPANGLRVGLVAGGLVGVVVTLLTGLANFWVVVVCGALGGGIGFWSAKRRRLPPTDD